MIDRANVLQGLEHCISDDKPCVDCPYKQKCIREGWIVALQKDVLELLKEQEAVEPILKRKGKSKMYNDYVCPVCDNEVVYGQCYCSECGKPFLWEGR